STDSGAGVGSVAVAIEDTTTGTWYTGSSFSAGSQTFLTASTSDDFAHWSYALASGKLSAGDDYDVTVETIDVLGNTNTSAQTAAWHFIATGTDSGRSTVTSSPGSVTADG